MARVAVRYSLQIVLVFRLRLPEGAFGHQFRNHLAGPQSRGVDIGDAVFRHAFLLIVRIEDRRTVAGADVVTLTVAYRRIVDLEEELEQIAVAGLLRISR